jgi:hypothetical protein
VTALEDWWAVEANQSLTTSQKQALYDDIRAAAFLLVELPFYVELLEITRIEVAGNRVDVSGVGNFSWPLRIYNAPVGVADPDGNIVKADGSTWYSDPIEVIAQCIRSAP